MYKITEGRNHGENWTVLEENHAECGDLLVMVTRISFKNRPPFRKFTEYFTTRNYVHIRTLFPREEQLEVPMYLKTQDSIETHQ